jgi:nitroreductase
MDVLTAITLRRSVREYDRRPIASESLLRLLQALRYAPSACNLQPWHFILVQDEKLRRDVAAACRGQHWMADAALTVVACGFPQMAYKRIAGQYNSVEIDLSIALDHLSLAAAAEGLGTCWIGAFDEQAIKNLVHAPPTCRVLSLMAVGHPKSPDLNYPVSKEDRKAPAEIFSSDTYGKKLAI